MNLMPKSPFQWLVVGVLIFAYTTSYNESKQIAEQNAEKEDAKPVINVVPDQKEAGLSDKAVGYLLKEFSKTDQGQAFIQSMGEKTAKKKYGDNDVSLVDATEKNKIITIDKIIGQGDSATCGSKVKIHSVITSKYKIQIDNTKEANKPLTLTIGEGASLKGIENGIVGMKKGGIRKLALPPSLAYADDKFKNDLVEKTDGVVVEVELLDLEKGRSSDLGIKTSDVLEGTGIESVICGSKVDVTYTTASGETGSLSFIIGDKTNPNVIEEAVLGMKIGGQRKLEIPSGLLKDDKTGLGSLKTEQEENLQIEVTLYDLQGSV